MNHTVHVQFLIILTVIAGCATQPDQRVLAVIEDRQSDPAAVEEAIQHLGRSNEPASFWTKIANDTSYSVEQRRACVMQLFRRHVKVGISLAEMAQRLSPSDWLSASDVQNVTTFMGWLPVKTNGRDSVLKICILPPDKPDLHMSAVCIRVNGLISSKDFYDVLNKLPVSESVRTAKVKEIGFFQQ
jgi:hypothetical protein